MDKFDIIILGGQSNAEGGGIGPVQEEYVPDEKICHLEAEKTVEVTPDGMRVTYMDKPFVLKVADERIGKEGNEKGLTIGDFSLTFSKRYVESGMLENGRKLLIIRGAIGGTGFQKGNWGLTAQVYLKLLEMTDYALSLNPENRIVAFLWHQGEHDAFEKNPPENYKKQLFEVISDVRSKYGNMPFIAGDFVNEWKSKNIEICEPIINAIKGVVADLGNSAFVETSDLLSNNQTMNNGDDIHFSRESLHILGERYFETFQKIKQK